MEMSRRRYHPAAADVDVDVDVTHKRARIPASIKAILGLREVVTDIDNDDDCAICLKPLAAAGRRRPDDDDDQEQQDAAAAAADDDAEEATTTATSMTTTLRAMPCSHIFHQHCIFQWLHRSANCPLCRHQLPTIMDDYGDQRRQTSHQLPANLAAAAAIFGSLLL